MITTNQKIESVGVLNPENDLLLTFSDVLDIGTLEKELINFFETCDPETEHLILDFKACVFIEVASLVRIISLITYRKRIGLSTQITLPEKKGVRDFMRLWKFPEAILEATNIPFHNLVVSEGHKYFGENKNPEDLTYGGTVLSEGEGRLLSKRFFSLLTKPFSRNDSVTGVVVKESRRWEDELVRIVLSRHLQGPDNYVASRIVYEMMSNACRHPNCSLIQIASRFESSADTSDTAIDHFTIVLWDDGESLLDTLKKPIRNGVSVRAKSLVDIYRFKVNYVDVQGSVSRDIIRSDFIPTKELEEYKILVSTLLPGITRDPSGKDHTVHQDLMAVPEFSFPGMGLFILINAVVDVFGGSVAFRTNRFFMNVKAPTGREIKKEGISYRVKVQEYSEKLPPFFGNMITIRLPTRRSSD